MRPSVFSLGATARQTFLIYLIQAGAMGLIGSVAGILLGLGVLYLRPQVLADVLPLDEIIDWMHAWQAPEGYGAAV